MQIDGSSEEVNGWGSHLRPAAGHRRCDERVRFDFRPATHLYAKSPADNLEPPPHMRENGGRETGKTDDETHLSPKRVEAETQPRLSPAHGDQARPAGSGAPPGKGPQAAQRLKRA